MRYPGPRSHHVQWDILVQGFMHRVVSWSKELCTVRYPGPGIMHSEVSRSGKSCTVGYPGQGGIHSGVSWPGESFTLKYPGPGRHAQWGIMARRVMHSEVSWPGQSCIVVTMPKLLFKVCLCDPVGRVFVHRASGSHCCELDPATKQSHYFVYCRLNQP